jgi:hypothetical protein
MMRESVERESGGSARANTNSGKRKGFFHHLDKVTTPFFFTNFPDSTTTGELWKIFLQYGRVGEVYIPKKLDRRGRRFGFVKFKEVTDEEELSERLCDVWIGSFKLWINRSRFARSEPKEEKTQQVTATRPVISMEETTPGRSFRSALVGNGASMEVLKVPVNEELCKELRGSMVGRLAREKNVKQIQTTLCMEGFRSITVTHMGDNRVLLRSPVEGDVERLLKSKNECLSYYFADLKPWNPGLIATHREVWVQIYGIPIHSWGEDLFKLVGKRLGGFVDFDEETARMARFDVARIKILSTSWAFIDVVVKVEVEGVIFDLWVVEERERKKPVVMLNEEMEDEGSRVFPVEDCGVEDEVSGEGEYNSGADEESGAEEDVDRGKGVSQVVESDGTKGHQRQYEGEVVLTCMKSTHIVNSNMEILPAPQGVTDKVGHVMRQEDTRLPLAVDVVVEVREDCGPNQVEAVNQLGGVSPYFY